MSPELWFVGTTEDQQAVQQIITYIMCIVYIAYITCII